jgi:Kef-type K+ transport system membrane component KefB
VPVTESDIAQLTLVALCAVVAPLLGELLKRFAVPGVVIEILLGVAVGPQALDLVQPHGVIADFGNMGLALLMFLAGYELELQAVRGRPLALAGMGWGCSLAVAAATAGVLLVAGHRHGEVVIGLCLTTTALGTLLPLLRDGGLLVQAFGRYVLAIGSIGEFGPIVLVALLLGRTKPVLTALLLVGFGVVAVGLAFAAGRSWSAHVRGAVRRGLHSSSQLPVRLSMLLVLALVLLATRLGLDVLLGSFAAGVVVRIAVTGQEHTDEAEAFRGKLEGIGFGLFVPIFFVVSGSRLNLSAFGKHPVALIGVPLFLLLMLVARGAPVLFLYRRSLGLRERLSLGMLSATALPLIVVITTIGADDDYISSQTAAALVAAGMVSVLILPAVALRVLGPTRARTRESSAP